MGHDILTRTDHEIEWADQDITGSSVQPGSDLDRHDAAARRGKEAIGLGMRSCPPRVSEESTQMRRPLKVRSSLLRDRHGLLASTELPLCGSGGDDDATAERRNQFLCSFVCTLNTRKFVYRAPPVMTCVLPFRDQPNGTYRSRIRLGISRSTTSTRA